MASIFTLPQQVVFDDSGVPLLGAKLYFYEIASSTPKDTYIDSALSEPHSNPVQSDASGVFPPIWLSEAGTDYRVTLTNQFDVEIRTVDGVISTSTPTDILNAIETVDGSGSGLDADLLDGLNSDEFAQLATDQTVTGIWQFAAQPTLFGFDMGFRNIPVKEKTAQYTLRLSDDGYCISNTTGGILIPVVSNFPFEIGAFPQGFTACFYNDSGANQTITAATPATTTIRLAATGTTGNRVLAQYGLAVLYQVKLNTWLVYGAGVS